MRVNMGREGRTSSSLSANGGSMLGALILANGPSQPLEAATKYYVDSTFASLKVFCVSSRGKFVISWGLILSNDRFQVLSDSF